MSAYPRTYGSCPQCGRYEDELGRLRNAVADLLDYGRRHLDDPAPGNQYAEVIVERLRGAWAGMEQEAAQRNQGTRE